MKKRPGSSRPRPGLRGTSLTSVSTAVSLSKSSSKSDKDPRPTVAIRLLPPASASQHRPSLPVVCGDASSRRVWIERPSDGDAAGEGGGVTQLFSSTFDCVAPEAELARLYDEAARPSVSHFLSGQRAAMSAVLCFGEAAGSHVTLFGDMARGGAGSGDGLALRAAAQALTALRTVGEGSASLSLRMAAAHVHCEVVTDLLAGIDESGVPSPGGAVDAAGDAGEDIIAKLASPGPARRAGSSTSRQALGTTQVVVASEDEARQLLQRACRLAEGLRFPPEFAHSVVTLSVERAAPRRGLARQASSGNGGAAAEGGSSGGDVMAAPGATLVLAHLATGLAPGLEAGVSVGSAGPPGEAGGADAGGVPWTSALHAADRSRTAVWSRLSSASRRAQAAASGGKGRGARGASEAAKDARPPLLARALGDAVLDGRAGARLTAVCHVRAGPATRGEREAMAVLQQAQTCLRVRFRGETKPADANSAAGALQSLLDERRAEVGPGPRGEAAAAARREELRAAAAGVLDHAEALGGEVASAAEQVLLLRTAAGEARKKAEEVRRRALEEEAAGGGAKEREARLRAAREEVARKRERLRALTRGGGRGPRVQALQTQHASPVPPLPISADFEHQVDAAWKEREAKRQEKEVLQRSLQENTAYVAYMSEARQAHQVALQAVGDNLHLLGWEKRNGGHPRLALPLYAAALAIYETVLGPSHPQAASTLVNLGNALFDLGRHGEAAALYRRSLAIDEEVLGDDHPDVAMDLSNLGIVYRNMGYTRQAVVLFERAHELLQGALGAEHASTLTVARNLAKLRAAASSLGPPDEAEGGALSGSDRSGGSRRSGEESTRRSGEDSPGPRSIAQLSPSSALTPRGLADEVTSTLEDEDADVETAERIGAVLLHDHVSLIRAEEGLEGTSPAPRGTPAPSGSTQGVVVATARDLAATGDFDAVAGAPDDEAKSKGRPRS